MSNLNLKASLTQAAIDVLAERDRQQSVEGWTLEHDDAHDRGQLADAAACYAAPDSMSWTDMWGRGLADDGSVRPLGAAKVSFSSALRWPWAKLWWKPKDRRSNLVRAGALIIAEIERIDRAAPSSLEQAEQGSQGRG